MLSLTCEKDWSPASFLGVSVQNHCGRSKAREESLPGCDWGLCFFHRVRKFRRERDQRTLTLSSGPEMSHWPTLVGHNHLWTKCQSFASEGLRIISRLMSHSLNCILMCFLAWCQSKGAISCSLRVSVTVGCACEQYLPWRHGGIKVEKLVTLSWWLSHTHWPAGQGQGSAAVLATPLPSTWGCGLRDLRGSLWFWTFTGVASGKGYLPLNLCLSALRQEKWLHWFWGGLQTIYANSVFWRRSH